MEMFDKKLAMICLVTNINKTMGTKNDQYIVIYLIENQITLCRYSTSRTYYHQGQTFVHKAAVTVSQVHVYHIYFDILHFYKNLKVLPKLTLPHFVNLYTAKDQVVSSDSDLYSCQVFYQNVTFLRDKQEICQIWICNNFTFKDSSLL